jgi:hypothetical protein
MSEKYGTNENLNIFLIFIYRLKLKVKRLKMALTLDDKVEIVLLSGRQGWTQRQVAVSLMPDILNYRLLCYCRSQYVEQNPHKHGKAAEKMRGIKFPLVPDFSDTP